MAKKLFVSPKADRDIDGHARYIGAHNRLAGRRFYGAVKRTFQDLCFMPEMAGLCDFSDPEFAELRIWPVRGYENYLIYDFSRTSGIEVVRVLHGAMDQERFLGPRT